MNQDSQLISNNEELCAEIKEAFDVFDTNKDGCLDFYEIKVAMKALGVDKNKSEILNALGGESFINYENFQKFALNAIINRDQIGEIERAFRLFDDDNSGSINIRKLKRVARELGQSISEEEMQSMIEQFDLNGDGLIDIDEFKAIMKYGHV
ncbi:hypothetical protein GJ496_001066 [Pomphorhynchus laevis]|nr:hypothetical protein GJ496_001066 [Pomphorhynchus laevis]